MTILVPHNEHYPGLSGLIFHFTPSKAPQPHTAGVYSCIGQPVGGRLDSTLEVKMKKLGWGLYRRNEWVAHFYVANTTEQRCDKIVTVT